MSENFTDTKMILKKYENMLSLSKNELTNSILELKSNMDTSANYELLRRVHRSLTQYIEKKNDLVYVGFMGHFSSGKSSTINSLLNLSNEHQREVDLHPSDKAISLITHPMNEPSFIKLVSYGQIPVKPIMIENDFLKNIVFIDTPGSGDTDPLFVNELIQDYLPICDLLLYFFSSTNPLDKNDLPLLQSKYENLSLIPIKFVITRADEFKFDFDKAITEQNFSNIEAKKFIYKAKARIEEIIELIKIEEDDFFVIDNKKKFKVLELLNYIQTYASTNNIETKIKMHEYKVNLFRKTGIRIRDNFHNHLLVKLKILNKYVEDANSNITRYEDKVRITNNRLTETWKNYQSDMEKIKNKNVKDLEEPFLKIISEDLWQDQSILESIKKIYSSFNTFSSSPIKSYYSKVMEKIETSIRTYIEDIENEIDNLELNKFENLTYELEKFKVNDFQAPKIDFSAFVYQEISNMQTSLFDTTNEIYYFIKSKINSLSHRLLNHQPLPQLNEIINDAQSGLNHDIDVHFEHVYLYRAGVFSEHVKEYIARLGIANKLNQLEREFDDQFKEKIKGSANEIIFPNFSEIKNKYQAKIHDLKKEFDLIQEDFKSIDLKKINFEKIISDSIINESSNELKNKLIDNINYRLQDEIKNTINEIERYIRSKKTELLRNSRSLKKKRIIRFFAFIAISASIVLPFTIFNYLKLSDNMANNFIISLIANFIIPVISIIIANLTDKYPAEINSSKQQYKNEVIHEAKKTLKEGWDKFKENNDEQVIISEHVRETLDNQLNDIRKQPYCTVLIKLYNKLYQLHLKEIELRKCYIEEIIFLTQSLMSFFEYDDKKLEKISSDIKKEAIEPSFEFLENLKNEINSVNRHSTQL